MPTPEQERQLAQSKEEGVKECNQQNSNNRLLGLGTATAATLYTATSGGLGRGGMVLGAAAVIASEFAAEKILIDCLKKEGFSEEEINNIKQKKTSAEQRAEFRELTAKKKELKKATLATSTATAPIAPSTRVSTPAPTVTFSSPSPNFSRQSDFGRSVTHSHQAAFSNFVSRSVPPRADISFTLPSSSSNSSLSSSSSLNYTPASAPRWEPGRFGGSSFGW